MCSERRGSLYLLPNTLGDVAPEAVIPAGALDRARSLDYLIAEDPKAARAFLKRIAPTRPLQSIRVERLDHNTRPIDIPALLEPLVDGRNAGLLSEAGLPAVADPGASLVRLAHEQNIRVVPLSGPSSIVLALAASGLDGQRFAFHGYLPIAEAELVSTLKECERQSRKLRQTQIFIETPYRNDRTLAAMLRTLAPATLVCVAADLTLESEAVKTRPVVAWRKETPQLKGRPTVFLLLSE
ncbi:MAG: SAM-dependent methyltransferase [Betaproteobacteria bacterium]|nr:MAG: SAM-dependent methyltransferase [Betaproteobacteria bacterium]TMH79765.1 MAG: SAM-dependent methyltransferase [Betaproteobacteria bacterium]